MKWFKNKRKQIAKALPKNSALMVASAPEYFCQPDIKYPYRQDSNFYYLTGFEQANSLLLMFASGRSILFIADRDPVKEIWEGPLYSVEETRKRFLMEEVYPLRKLETKLSKHLKGKTRLFYDSLNPFFNKKLKAFKTKFLPVGEMIKPFRRLKDKREISFIKKAVSASIYAHEQVAKSLRPGMMEKALHGVFLKSIMEKGSFREAYQGIFACGNNATVLHYTDNRSVCKTGELLLVDAGAEWSYYSSDITRVYPVKGKFSPNQKKLYQNLLDLQKKLIKEVKPGACMKDINRKMYEGVTHILLEWGFLKGSFKENFSQKSYHKYCPHSVGHLLGLDTHDVTFQKEKKFILKPGMVLTIEPGIYISREDRKAPKDLKGIGLRIEDDILVTPTGHKNLSYKMVKEIPEIEKLCQA